MTVATIAKARAGQPRGPRAACELTRGLTLLPMIDEHAAIRQAWARYDELLAAAKASGDPDDVEAAEDAYLEAMDVTGEAGQWSL